MGETSHCHVEYEKQKQLLTYVFLMHGMPIVHPFRMSFKNSSPNNDILLKVWANNQEA